MDTYWDKVSKITKDEGAKIMAVKYVLDFNTFRKSDRFKSDLVEIRMAYSGDDEYEQLFNKYCDELRKSRNETPRWARLIMAERYALRV